MHLLLTNKSLKTTFLAKPQLHTTLTLIDCLHANTQYVHLYVFFILFQLQPITPITAIAVREEPTATIQETTDPSQHRVVDIPPVAIATAPVDPGRCFVDSFLCFLVTAVLALRN